MANMNQAHPFWDFVSGMQEPGNQGPFAAPREQGQRSDPWSSYWGYGGPFGPMPHRGRQEQQGPPHARRNGGPRAQPPPPPPPPPAGPGLVPPPPPPPPAVGLDSPSSSRSSTPPTPPESVPEYRRGPSLFAHEQRGPPHRGGPPHPAGSGGPHKGPGPHHGPPPPGPPPHEGVSGPRPGSPPRGPSSDAFGFPSGPYSGLHGGPFSDRHGGPRRGPGRFGSRHGHGGPHGHRGPRSGGPGDFGSAGFPFDLNNIVERFAPHVFPGAFPEARFAPRKTRNNDNDDDGTFTPQTDVFSTEKAYILHVALPGAKKKDIAVTYSAAIHSVNLSGVIARPDEVDEEMLASLVESSRDVGIFAREIKLPNEGIEVDEDKISAKLEDGVLRVVVPKMQKEDEWTEVKVVDIE